MAERMKFGICNSCNSIQITHLWGPWDNPHTLQRCLCEAIKKKEEEAKNYVPPVIDVYIDTDSEDETTTFPAYARQQATLD